MEALWSRSCQETQRLVLLLSSACIVYNLSVLLNDTGKAHQNGTTLIMHPYIAVMDSWNRFACAITCYCDTSQTMSSKKQILRCVIGLRDLFWTFRDPLSSLYTLTDERNSLFPVSVADHWP